MNKNKIKEKSHRLDKKFYVGFVRVTFTLCIDNRKKLFVKDNIVNKFKKILKEELEKEKTINYVYTFMPDHIHLINEGADEGANLLKSINLFKQRTGFWLSKNRPKFKWQKDYYDHIHREKEKLKPHLYYILNNPVRKCLVNNFDEYKYSGSLDFDLDELLYSQPL